ncbi:unnamed protein product [Pleuronectes platessa]|uniref:Uncharacterized protein n=1 Tax=Pleuronectes platessa TaxID=8262 RepID=A0A9N7YMG8_PLEPL|nr:unnamed protein product [Pleuronectes platessa]
MSSTTDSFSLPPAEVAQQSTSICTRGLISTNESSWRITPLFKDGRELPHRQSLTQRDSDTVEKMEPVTSHLVVLESPMVARDWLQNPSCVHMGEAGSRDSFIIIGPVSLCSSKSSPDTEFELVRKRYKATTDLHSGFIQQGTACLIMRERRWTCSRNLDYGQKRSLVRLWFDSTEKQQKTNLD